MLQLLLGGATGCCCQAREADGELEHDAPMAPVFATSELIVDSEQLRALPFGPRERMVTTYAISDSEVLHGEPLCTGTILQLTLGESIQEMWLALHVNGFSLSPCESIAAGQPRTTCRVWSPFSLVEKCQVKTMQHSAFWAVFKLTVFRREGLDRSFYFATTGSNAYRERDRWVDEMVTAINNVTLSLFPPHAITVTPLPGVANTYTRILAGYLLLSGSEDCVTLVYCELHAYCGGEARFVAYRDEWCFDEVSSLALSDTSVVSTRKGAYCTVFGIDHHRFCARSREEKDLWLRAVSNVKVKLMFDAPDPTDYELAVFRAAVHDRVRTLPEVQKPAPDPLLSQVPRAPPMSPRGDALDPEPIDEGDLPKEANVRGAVAFRGPPPADVHAAPPPPLPTSSAAKLRSFDDAADLPGEVDDVANWRAEKQVVAERLAPEDCRRLLDAVASSPTPSGPRTGGRLPTAVPLSKGQLVLPREPHEGPLLDPLPLSDVQLLCSNPEDVCQPFCAAPPPFHLGEGGDPDAPRQLVLRAGAGAGADRGDLPPRPAGLPPRRGRQHAI